MKDLIEIDLDTEDELRQAVLASAFEFCQKTRQYRDNIVEYGPSWGIEPPAHFIALHATVDALVIFKQTCEKPMSRAANTESARKGTADD